MRQSKFLLVENSIYFPLTNKLGVKNKFPGYFFLKCNINLSSEMITLHDISFFALNFPIASKYHVGRLPCRTP